MGKMSELLKEYKTCPVGSPRESEITSELYKIVDWMKDNGHLTKPFKLPRKSTWRGYGSPMRFNPDGKEDGDYCGYCNLKLPDSRGHNCPKCGWGLGVVFTVSHPKSLNTRIRRV